MLQLDFLEKEALSAAGLERVGSIRRALDQVRQLVCDLQSFSRSEPAEVELQSVRAEDVILQSLRLADVRLRGSARIESVVSDALPNIRVSPRQLGQVLLNLLFNAVEALEEQRARGSDTTVDAFIRVTAQASGGRVLVAIEDNGPGIPAQVMGRLFEPYFSTKAEKGTGLGLALSREYIDRFGGVLRAENRAGGGARFVIDLPALYSAGE